MVERKFERAELKAITEQLSANESKISELGKAISSLEEKIKEIKPEAIPKLEERLEAIEDLVAVEQAGILEFRKVLEELAVPAAPPEIESLKERIDGLESFKSEAMGLLKGLDERVEILAKLPMEVPKDIALLKGSVDELSKRITILEKKPVIVPEKILEESRRSISIVGEKISALEKVAQENAEKFKGIEEEIKKVWSLLEKRPVIEPKDLEESRREIGKIDKRIGDFEISLANFNKRVSYMEELAKKLPEEKKLVELSKEIGERIKKAEEIEKTLSSKTIIELTKKIEDIKTDLEKRTALIETLEKGTKISQESIKKLEASVAELEKVKPEEISILSKEIGDIKSRLREDLGSVGEEVKKISSEIERIRKIEPEKIEKDMENVRKVLEESLNRLRFNEEEITKLSEVIRGLEKISPKEIEKLSSDVGKAIEEISKLSRATASRLDAVESEIGKIRRVEPAEIEKTIGEMRAESKRGLNELKSLLSAAISPLDSQLKSLSERLVLLETRIAALEELSRKRAAAPVIIE